MGRFSDGELLCPSLKGLSDMTTLLTKVNKYTADKLLTILAHAKLQYAPELQHYEQLSQQYKQYKSTLHWNDLPPDLAESINRTDSTLSQLENSPTISTMTRHAIGFNMYHLVSAFQQCVQERGQLSPGDGGDMQFLMVQAGERATAQASQDHQAMQALRAFISEVPSLLQGDQSSYPAQQHDSIPAAAPASGYRFPHHPVTHGVGPSSGAYVSHGHSSHPLHGSGSTAGEEVDPLQEKRTGKLGKEGKELEKQQKKEAKERKKALKKEEERHRISGTDKLHKVKDKSVKHKKEKEKKKQKHRKESGSDSGSGSGCGSYYSDDSDSDSGSD